MVSGLMIKEIDWTPNGRMGTPPLLEEEALLQSTQVVLKRFLLFSPLLTKGEELGTTKMRGKDTDKQVD